MISEEVLEHVKENKPKGTTHIINLGNRVEYIQVFSGRCKMYNHLDCWSVPISNSEDIFLNHNPLPVELLEELLYLREWKQNVLDVMKIMSRK